MSEQTRKAHTQFHRRNYISLSGQVFRGFLVAVCVLAAGFAAGVW